MFSRLFRDTGYEADRLVQVFSLSSVIFIDILDLMHLPADVFRSSCESVARYRVRSLRKIGSERSSREM